MLSSPPCSLPLAGDLIETCIDDVLRAPAVVAAATAAEEAGPSGAFAGASGGAAASIAGDDPLSLSGEAG